MEITNAKREGFFFGGGAKIYLFLNLEKKRRQPAVGAGRAGG